MSRDWTPREMYLVEKHNIKTGHGSWWDFMENSTWVINGKTLPMCTPETIAHRREYPCLGRLFEEYDELYSFLSQLPGGLDLLGRYDKTLSDYIETGVGDKNSFLIRWFEGELDEHFYYRERNDELFLEAIREEAASLSNQKKMGLDDQIRGAANRADGTGAEDKQPEKNKPNER